MRFRSGTGAGKLVFPALAFVLCLLAGLLIVRFRPEWEFRRARLTPGHVAQASFRGRLESMPPGEVQRFLEQAHDAGVVDYLQRLMEFSREQEALRLAPEGERMSITFIMGEDAGPGNRFYRAATDYFRADDSARTEVVVTNLRTLAGVRDYLAEHRPANGRPWGVINVVAHTYEWGGLSFPIRHGQGRTDFVTLRRAITTGELAPLPDSVVDCRTELTAQGCALGRDSVLLDLLGKALGGADMQRPQVRSSRYFVNFGSAREAGRLVSVEQFFSEYWYVTYPKGRRPGRAELSRRFRDRYDLAQPADWADALSRQNPRRPGDTYCRSYGLPVTWFAVYPDSGARPALATTRDERMWLESQSEFALYLGRLGLSFDDFLWTIRDTLVPEGDSVKPAIWALGRAAIVSVLRELTVPDSLTGEARHARARPHDQRFFAAVIPARPAAQPFGWNVEMR